MSDKKLHIAWVSDFDPIGSGYLNLSVPLCTGLQNRGHDVKVAGLGYAGQEHNYPFSIIPAQNFNEVHAILVNLANMWKIDATVVALDIPLQERMLFMLQQRPFKYVGIMPIEADPLCISWAMVLMQMEKVFIISQFGTNEAQKVGVPAEHLQIGIDTDLWRIPTPEERANIRKSFGYDEDDFVVLTVADNQERKNLSRAMEIFADFSRDKKAKYVMVTREHNPVGWKLRDYAVELGINDNFIIYERGMPLQDLWAIYASSNVFLLTSKAEGLGLPLLEAMSVGIPCIGTACTAISEVLGENRGLLIAPDYSYRDPFGNGNRYFASRNDGVNGLFLAYEDNLSYIKDNAKKHVEARKWEIAVDQLENALLEITK